MEKALRGAFFILVQSQEHSLYIFWQKIYITIMSDKDQLSTC